MTKKEEHFRDLTKLVMLFEVFQLQLDKVKNNPRVYRQSFKNKLNAAEKEMDMKFRDALLNLYETDEPLYTGLRDGIDHYTENVLDATLEWLHVENQKLVSEN